MTEDMRSPENRDNISKKRGYVFCGGTISEEMMPGIGRALSDRAGAYVVAADRGLVFLERHGIVPDLVVGDFDSSPEGFIESYRAAHPDVPVRTYNPVKDYTDSEIGARAAAEAGCREVVLIGATGTRLDHVLGNIQVLAYLEEAGVRGMIVDPCNRITLWGEGPGRKGGEVRIRKDEQWGKYVSLFAYGGDVTGLCLYGFYYTVHDFLLTAVGSRAVSNEITEQEGRITYSSGKLLVIESRDMPGH